MKALRGSGRGGWLAAPVVVAMALLVACGGGKSTSAPGAGAGGGGGSLVPADATQSTLTAAPNTATADGNAAVTVTVVAKDKKGAVIAGAPVTVASSGANNKVTPASATTDATGQVVVNLTSTTAEAKSVTATIGAVTLPAASVTFNAGPPAAVSSSLVANPTTVAANGTAALLTVTVRDATGNPIPNALVTFSSTGTATFVQPPVTDANGVASGQVSSTVLGSQTITATFGTTAVATTPIGFGVTAGTRTVAGATLVAQGLTVPESGLILSGTTINPATGKPFRHLWFGDEIKGLCRLDPDIDSPGVKAINPTTCMLFIGGGLALKAGQLAFDPATNNIYAVDIQANTQGIFRLHFLPGGDLGHGTLDLIHQEQLGGVGACTIAAKTPNSAVLGPDGALYVGFKAAGDIVKIVSPGLQPLPCANVSTIGFSGDGTRSFGLAWIGHDLYSGDGFSPFVIPNADLCTAAAPCQGASILAGQVALPSAVISDQVFPAVNGTTVWFANPSTVTQFTVVPAQTITTLLSGFSIISGLTADPANLAKLYVGDDPGVGNSPGTGDWWSIP